MAQEDAEVFEGGEVDASTSTFQAGGSRRRLGYEREESEDVRRGWVHGELIKGGSTARRGSPQTSAIR